MRNEVNNNVGCSSSVVECWALNINSCLIVSRPQYAKGSE